MAQKHRIEHYTGMDGLLNGPARHRPGGQGGQGASGSETLFEVTVNICCQKVKLKLPQKTPQMDAK